MSAGLSSFMTKWFHEKKGKSLSKTGYTQGTSRWASLKKCSFFSVHVGVSYSYFPKMLKLA